MKVSNEIWNDHDSYTVILLSNTSYYVTKNNMDQLEIEDCPENIQEQLTLELNRLKANLAAENLTSKKQIKSSFKK